MVSYEGVDDEKITPSLLELLKLREVGGIPLWFISAYPDVAKWFLGHGKKIEKTDAFSYRKLIDSYLETSNIGLECR